MVFQSWFDDSGNKGNGRALVVAGLLGDAEAFARLAERWDMALRARHPGAIRYFKFDEARGLDGEFRHWRPENRDAKVRQLATVLGGSDGIVATATVIDLAAFEDIWRLRQRLPDLLQPMTRKNHWNQPYVMAALHSAIVAAQESAEREDVSRIEIVFDDQDAFKDHIVRLWPELLRALRKVKPDVAPIFPAQPWFRNDMDFVVLQAADLAAGETRMLAETNQPIPDSYGDFLGGLKIAKYGGVFNRRTQAEWAKSALQRQMGDISELINALSGEIENKDS